jgi:hypothetical protein
MPQYPIPQFIESEGKIIFFLTFRQFFILLGGGVICFALFYALPSFLFFPLALVVIGITLAIGFLKIDNVSIVQIFLSFVGFSFNSKNYTWQKKESSYPSQIKQHYEIKKLQDIPVQRSTTNRLQEIKKMVELKK